MKKTVSSFSVLLFLLSYNSYTQESKILGKSTYRVLYNYSFQKDSTNTSRLKTDDMELLIGNRYSLFQSLNNKFNDSLYNSNETKIKTSTDQSEIISLLADKKKEVLKFKILKHKNSVTTYDKILVDSYKYNENVNFKWEILKDTLTMNSYKCNKATTIFAGRTYIAWFTKEIPISEGPYKFNGLPGLIVKIYDTKNQHVFELTNFSRKILPITLYKDIFINNGLRQTVTKKQYFHAIKSFKNDPMTYFVTRMKLEVTKDNRQQKQRQYQRAGDRFKANPLELKLE